jgi:hypothetical protein
MRTRRRWYLLLAVVFLTLALAGIFVLVRLAEAQDETPAPLCVDGLRCEEGQVYYDLARQRYFHGEDYAVITVIGNKVTWAPREDRMIVRDVCILVNGLTYKPPTAPDGSGGTYDLPNGWGQCGPATITLYGTGPNAITLSSFRVAPMNLLADARDWLRSMLRLH